MKIEPNYMLSAVTIGFFLVAMVLEFILQLFRAKPVYSWRDSATNLTLYLGSLAIDFLWVPVTFTIYTWVHQYSLTQLGYQWWLFQDTVPLWHWGALLITDDFCFYCFHRTSHKVWLLWASHENHHSSNHFNLTVAARQTWTPFFAFVFWLPLAYIGFDPLMILTMQMLSLLYQSLLHTQLIPGFGALGWILNTPSHHRVHHGHNPNYLDRNFAGVFIIWDRLFGTFVKEDEPVVFGTGQTGNTYSPFQAVTGEFRRMLAAAARAPGFAKIKTLFIPPGTA